MARYSKCIFCKKTDSPPSEEDIFAKWIAREWPKGRFVIEVGFLGSEPDKTWGARSGPGKHSALGFVTNRPCTRCNSGWMSRLENAAKEVLKPLIWGRNSTLTSSDQLLLAQWLLKTAMTWEFFHERINERFFTPSERFAFHLEPHVIPRHYIMSIGHYVGGQDVWLLDGPGLRLGLAIDGTTIRGDGYVTTFTIGQLALQVFAHRWSQNVPVSRINVAVPGNWRTNTRDIWPQNLASFSWPPSIALDNAAMIDLAQRFYKLIAR